MKSYNHIIIGGGIAGTTAAETIRKNDPDCSIAIVSDEPYPLYSRIMLSKPAVFLEKVPFDKIWMKKKEWYLENRIDFLSGKKAVGLDTEKKVVTLDDDQQLSYEKLLIATGACARAWVAPGSDKQGVFNLRSMEDGKAIMDAKKSAKHAVAIGGGFISFEVAHLLNESGIEVTIVVREPSFWETVLDPIASKMVGNAIEKSGVKVLYNEEVSEVLGEDKVKAVQIKSGDELECELVVVGIGVTCMLDWLADSGIECNRGVAANEYLETNVKDVWVAGDVAEYKDLVLDETVIMANWANAQEQGKVAAHNMLGNKTEFKCVTFYSTHGFGMNLGFVGDVRLTKDRKVISRGSAESNSYSSIIVVRDEIIGATLVNRNQDMGTIKKLIEQNVKVADKLDELADPNFDLTTLLHVK